MVYLPLASQHLDVKTIGRGGPLRRLLKPDKGRPFLRACQRLPVEVAPQVGMSVRGAAVFLRVGYVAGHCMAYIRLQTRSGDVSVGSKGDIGGRLDEVCFTPMNGHRQTAAACPFGANSGSRTCLQSDNSVSRKHQSCATYAEWLY